MHEAAQECPGTEDYRFAIEGDTALCLHSLDSAGFTPAIPGYNELLHLILNNFKVGLSF
jgi:hypothetical protein